MSGNSLNVNVSGGTASFGAIGQGTRHTISGTAQTTSIGNVDNHLSDARSSIAALARNAGKDEKQIDAVMHEVTSLKTEAEQPTPDEGKASAILRTIRENFDWAYPAMTDIVKAIWPAILNIVKS